MSGLRLLLCVDGSPAALEAARFALELAAEHGGQIRAVSVQEDGEITRRFERPDSPLEPARDRLVQGVRALLDRIAAMGAQRAVAVETAMLHGDPLRELLSDARTWQPGLLVIGRTGRSGPGSPMLGSLALQLLEFTEWPVIVVPARESSRMRISDTRR